MQAGVTSLQCAGSASWIDVDALPRDLPVFVPGGDLEDLSQCRLGVYLSLECGESESWAAPLETVASARELGVAVRVALLGALDTDPDQVQLVASTSRLRVEKRCTRTRGAATRAKQLRAGISSRVPPPRVRADRQRRALLITAATMRRQSSRGEARLTSAHRGAGKLADVGAESIVLHAGPDADMDDLREAVEAVLWADVVGLPMAERLCLNAEPGDGGVALCVAAATEMGVKSFSACARGELAPGLGALASALAVAGCELGVDLDLAVAEGL